MKRKTLEKKATGGIAQTNSKRQYGKSPDMPESVTERQKQTNPHNFTRTEIMRQTKRYTAAHQEITKVSSTDNKKLTATQFYTLTHTIKKEQSISAELLGSAQQTQTFNRITAN